MDLPKSEPIIYEANPLIEIIDKGKNLDRENFSNLSLQDNEKSNLDILKEFGLIGCISAEPNLSTNYKFVLREELEG
ncbi:hypothetical protein ACN4EE_20680 [Geminocystis sp. CENA526]|uniref:hypothetical protein n=1 Tax=Geminocystis sp. CENA526 TaxID=1355871 RepID=UPI003D6F3878